MKNVTFDEFCGALEIPEPLRRPDTALSEVIKDSLDLEDAISDAEELFGVVILDHEVREVYAANTLEQFFEAIRNAKRTFQPAV